MEMEMVGNYNILNEWHQIEWSNASGLTELFEFTVTHYSRWNNGFRPISNLIDIPKNSIEIFACVNWTKKKKLNEK